MAYEKECDIALRYISVKGSTWDAEFYCAIRDEGVEMTDEKFEIITSILIAEKFMKSTEDRASFSSKTHTEIFAVTDKGRAFVSTDNFINRAKRWELERKLNEQQSALNLIELGLKPYTFIIALLGLGVAIGSLIIALCAVLKK